MLQLHGRLIDPQSGILEGLDFFLEDFTRPDGSTGWKGYFVTPREIIFDPQIHYGIELADGRTGICRIDRMTFAPDQETGAWFSVEGELE